MMFCQGTIKHGQKEGYKCEEYTRGTRALLKLIACTRPRCQEDIMSTSKPSNNAK